VLEVHEREGFKVEREGGIAVAISTILSPELLQEGLARELVHHIQNTRKSADFEIDDRILLRVTGPVEVTEMLALHGEWVKKETLALGLEVIAADSNGARAPLGSGAHTEEVKVNGMPVTIEVVRA
jgi:isoleucyl-tRNA synthetase